MNANDTLQISLPDQTQSRHELFELNRESVASWIRSLPGANFGETTKQLYSALTELNKVKCAPKKRLQILEQLRPHVHTANRGLERHYLNKPIVLSGNAQRISQLSDALNTQMAVGYSIAVNELLAANRFLRSNSLLAKAIHRALTEHSLILLRNFQLYRSESPGFWINLHELFSKALLHKLAQVKIADDLWGDSTIEQCYLRPILLHAAHPYQLRQQRQTEVFTHLCDWASTTRVQTENLKDCVLAYSPVQDAAPRHQSDIALDPGWFGIDTSALCAELEKKLQKTEDRDDGYDVLMHLKRAWSTRAERDSSRTSCNDQLSMSLGLHSTHYFVAGEHPFTDFVKEGPKQWFNASAPNNDVWAQSSPEDVFDRAEHQEPPEEILIQAIDYEERSIPAATPSFHNYQVHVIDHSDGGYCVDWPNEATAKLNIGDVVGMRTAQCENWQIGLIRWVRGKDNNSHHLGLEVLTAGACACSARQAKLSTSSAEYHRALVLAPSEGGGVVNRLLLQRGVFHTGDTLEITQPGQVVRVKLKQRLEHTASISVYTFSPLDTPDQGTSEITDHNKNKEQAPLAGKDGANKQGFDNVWEVL